MKPGIGKKHSAEAQFVLMIHTGMVHTGMVHTLHHANSKCEILCSLIASMALDTQVVNGGWIAI
jgi:hypothetical protein